MSEIPVDKTRFIGEELVRLHKITSEDLKTCLAIQSKNPGTAIGVILVDRGLVSKDAINDVLLRQRLGSKYIPIEIPKDLVDVMALDGRKVYVLDSRRSDVKILSWVAETNRKIAPERLEVSACSMSQLESISTGSLDSKTSELDAIKKVRRMISDAAKVGASDIHFTLRQGRSTGGRGYARIQTRVKGSLDDGYEITEQDGEQMMRAMFQGMAAITDTSYQETEDQHAVINDPALLRDNVGSSLPISGLRLARAPLDDGMNLAIRLLYKLESGSMNETDLMGMLGYSRRQLKVLHFLSRQTMGVNPFTGPTGSGKSTTLANMIRMMLVTKKGSRLITIEDPIEFKFKSDYVWQYRIANANTDEEKNAAFSGKLKTALRQDPDLIMLGEIRGLETAKEAINAAITGHQVWTTLHVSDPFMIVQRLVAMGVDGFYLQDPKMLASLIAQRLVKTLCEECKVPLDLDNPPESLDRDDIAALLTWRDVHPLGLSGVYCKGKGCYKCNNTGIKGRTVVAHVIPTYEDILVDMVEKGPMVARRNYFNRSNPEVPMEVHGVLKILNGQVDIESVVEMLGPIIVKPDGLRVISEEDYLT